MSLTDRVLDLNDLVWQPFAMPLVLVVVGGLDLDRAPALRVQGVDVALPLAQREVRVDGAALEMGHQTLGDAGDGAGRPQCPSTSTSIWHWVYSGSERPEKSR